MFLSLFLTYTVCAWLWLIVSSQEKKRSCGPSTSKGNSTPNDSPETDPSCSSIPKTSQASSGENWVWRNSDFILYNLSLLLCEFPSFLLRFICAEGSKLMQSPAVREKLDLASKFPTNLSSWTGSHLYKTKETEP